MKEYIYFDTHSHHMAYPKNRLEPFLKSAQDLGVCVFFMAVDIETYLEIQDLAKKFANVIPCFGIHPQVAHKYINSLDQLEPYIKYAHVVGEIGLDSRWSDKAFRPYQKDVFWHLLKLSKKYNKPVSIHTTEAEAEVYGILKNFDCQNICIHWYHGDIRLLRKFVDLGCFFSIGPDIGLSQNAAEIAKAVPLKKLLCETDGPDAVAWAKNSKLCDKHFSPDPIIDVYDNLSETLGIEKNDIIQIIRQNVIGFLSTPKDR